jgi:hypothetical protein
MDVAASLSLRVLAMTLHRSREQLGAAAAQAASAPPTAAAQADVILQLSAAAQALVGPAAT